MFFKSILLVAIFCGCVEAQYYQNPTLLFAKTQSEFNSYAGKFNNTSSYYQLPSSTSLSFTDGACTDQAFNIVAWIKAIRMSNFRVISRSTGTGAMTFFFGADNSGLLTCVLYNTSTSNTIETRWC